MAKSNFSKLRVNGEHRHVILQAHANLGLAEGPPQDNGEPWKEGDEDRFEAEIERIASNPTEVADAVERFGPEVQRREIAQSEAKWAQSVKRTTTSPSR